MLFLSVLTFLIYGLTLSDEFIHSMDDDWGIYVNPLVQTLSLENLKKIWIGDTLDVYYIPLTFSVFAFEVALWGNNAYLFKLFSLTVFIGSGWLLYHLLSTFNINKIIVLLTVSLYLLHPFQIENIAWAASTRQILSMFFLLLTCIQILRAGTVFDNMNNQRYIASLLFFFLALAAKFTAVVFIPLYICAYFLYARQYGSTLGQAKHHFSRSIPYIILGIFFYLMNTKTLKTNFLEQELNYDLLQHALIIIGSFGFYIKLLFTGPFSFLYPIAAPEQFEYAKYIVYSVISVGIIIITVWSFFKNSLMVSVAGIWFLIALTPSSLLVLMMSDIPANTADRYFTMAAPGIFLLLAIATERIFRKFTPFIIPLLIFVLSFFTIQQIKIWDNVYSLFEYNLKHYPSEEFYHRFAIEQYKAGNKDQAFQLLEKADSLGRNITFNNPFFFEIELAYIYQLKGDSMSSKRVLSKLIESDLVSADGGNHSGLIRDKLLKMFPLSEDMNTNYAKYVSIRSEITSTGKMVMRPHRI